MTPAWAQRKEELLSDCIVSPEVFNPMVDRLHGFVVPYQHALEAEAGGHHAHLYLSGLLSHLRRRSRPWSMSSHRSCRTSLAPPPGIIAH